MIDYAQLLEVLCSRRSVRRFADQAISRDDLSRLFDAARWAPSNHNRQPWKFVVLEDRERIRNLARNVALSVGDKLKSLPALASPYASDLAHHATLFAQAPAVIVALHKRPVSVSAALLEGVPNPTLVSGEPLSVAMAVQNLVLAAHTLGLGACVMTAPLMVPDALTGGLQLPAGYELTCLIALGHPAESPEPPRRKTLEQIVEYLDDAIATHDDQPRDL
jgi:coenzyme F420-0:L-glutamate ligase / coenzyme F420-1:gamma-L-glutamate ligase